MYIVTHFYTTYTETSEYGSLTSEWSSATEAVSVSFLLCQGLPKIFIKNMAFKLYQYDLS